MTFVLKDIQVEHRPVAIGELLYHLLQHSRWHSVGIGLFRLCYICRYIIVIYEVQAPGCLYEVYRHVHHDAPHPCLQRPLSPVGEGVKLCEYLYE